MFCPTLTYFQLALIVLGINEFIQAETLLSHAGEVQVTIDGQTGSICAKDWGKTETIVLCRQSGSFNKKESTI